MASSTPGRVLVLRSSVPTSPTTRARETDSSFLRATPVTKGSTRIAPRFSALRLDPLLGRITLPLFRLAFPSESHWASLHRESVACTERPSCRLLNLVRRFSNKSHHLLASVSELLFHALPTFRHRQVSWSPRARRMYEITKSPVAINASSSRITSLQHLPAYSSLFASYSTSHSLTHTH